MRLDFLGDSLDHWKRSMLNDLRSSALVRQLQVVPMLTDAGQWRPDHLLVYARLLGLGSAADLLSVASLDGASRRRAYFDEIQENLGTRGRDLFIDPDNGMETSRNCGKRRVAIAELAKLATGDRLLLVFDQTRARGVEFSIHVGELRSRLRLADLHSAFWTGRQVAMAAISRDTERLAAVERHWRHGLGPLHANRVF